MGLIRHPGQRCSAIVGLIAIATTSLGYPALARAATPLFNSAPQTLAQAPDTDELLRLTNAERAAIGLSPLRLSAELGDAAQAHAEDMARRGELSHTGGDGSSMGDRIDATGYRYRAAGENVACGSARGSATLQQWMGSPGHRQNILNPDFTEIGFGQADGQGHCSPYWVQVFGTPLTPSASVPESTPAPESASEPVAEIDTVLLSTQGSLSEDDPTLSDGSRIDEYRFEGEVGQVVTIQLSSTEFDTYLIVIDGEGAVLAQNDDVSQDDTNSAVTLTLPTTSTYTVLANAYDATGRGRYQLTVVPE
ncbi:MAG: CAP domain-containing protein [Cyanobacteria bacterium J06628_6]